MVLEWKPRCASYVGVKGKVLLVQARYGANVARHPSSIHCATLATRELLSYRVAEGHGDAQGYASRWIEEAKLFNVTRKCFDIRR